MAKDCIAKSWNLQQVAGVLYSENPNALRLPPAFTVPPIAQDVAASASNIKFMPARSCTYRVLIVDAAGAAALDAMNETELRTAFAGATRTGQASGGAMQTVAE